MTTRSITSHALKVSLFILVLFVLPTGARAAVSISEVMYNPEGADSGREWVELYNSGSSDVTLVGGSGKGSWRISDSSNHTITDPAGGIGRGSLTIPAGGYLVLTSDPATFIGEYEGSYSVAKASLSLNNTGTTISLIDGAGAVVDSLSYTASQGGDDNGTSLQMASSAWLQALPTPGAANAAERYDPPVDTGSNSSSSSSNNSSASTPTSGFVPPPLPQIFATGGEDRVVTVGADTLFRAWAYDRAQTAYKSAKFVWNFGDGTSVEGSEVMHHFSYPGRYAVELSINDRGYSGSTRIVVTAKETEVGMQILPGGGVSIKNYSDRDLDISFWQIAQAPSTFSLPERSVVLKGASLNISSETLGFVAMAASLHYPNGVPVPMGQASAIDLNPLPPQSSVTDTMPTLAVQPQPPATQNTAAPLSVSEIRITPEQAIQSTASSTSEVSEELGQPELAASAALSEATLPLWGALAGLGGIMGLGVASVWAVRRKPVTGAAAEEFTIE